MSAKMEWHCIVIVVFLIPTIQTAIDPCTDFTPYSEVDKRSPDNPFNAAAPVSDQYLAEGWYGGMGMDIARKAPPMNRCGTVYPVWLQELTGTEARMCIVGSDGVPCKLKIPVEFKACGTFNVYKLKRTHQENSAYCVEPQNPGDIPPTYTHKPTVEAGVVTNGGRSKLQFQCKFPDTTIEFYSVTWYVEDDVIKHHGPVAFDEVRIKSVLTEAVLKEKGFDKPGFDVRCGVQAHKRVDSIGSDEQTSENRYIGIEILDPEVTIKEGECTDVRVKFTAPFGCMTEADDCAIGTELFDNAAPGGKCKGRAIARTVCGTQDIKRSKWDTPAILQVCGQIGIKYGSQTATQTLKLKTSQLFIPHDFWQDYDIGVITVKINREAQGIVGKRCSATNDPHMATYRGRLYEHHLTGVFTLYKHLQLPLEVQLETGSCGRTVKCNCGLAVRAGQTVFVLDRCGRSSWNIGYKQIQQGETLLDIQQNGNSYRILLPHGGLVTVQLRGKWLNVYITPSVKDQVNTGGLCGKLTKDCLEMTLRDGSVTTDAFGSSCNKGRRYYKRFSQNWRVAAGNNLFEENVRLTAWPTSELYCACPKRTGVLDFATKVECSAEKASEECTKMPGFKLIGQNRKIARRRRRDVSEVVESRKIRSAEGPTDTWTNGWTEEKAKLHCQEAFNSSQAVKMCKDVPNVDPTPDIENCILDIQMTGTDDFMISSVDNVRDRCVHEVMMDPEMEKSTGPDKPSMVEMVMNSVICPNECSHRGYCTEGKCVCEDNRAGVDCSVDLTKPPQISEVTPQSGCNVHRCEHVTVMGETFFESTQLKCRVTHIRVYEDVSVEQGVSEVEEAEFQNINELTCRLPNISTLEGVTRTHVNGFRLAVTNGVSYSDDTDLLVLDSRCQRSKGGLKWETTGSFKCIYNGRCIVDDNEGNRCQQAAPSGNEDRSKATTFKDTHFILTYLSCFVIFLRL